MRRLRALVDEPLPTVPRSREEYQAELDELGCFLDREALAEQDRLWKETDAARALRCHRDDHVRSTGLARGRRPAARLRT
jgi:hypothetical protein